ncbi:hypothetical protein UlMin_013001 [Ulmus minor]
MGYEMFKDFISLFLKIDYKKLVVDMKFNSDIQEMSDWYDIVDDDSLSIFLCYAFENPKKYHLFVSVYAKDEGHSSFRMNGTDSFEEDCSGGRLFDDDLATQLMNIGCWMVTKFVKEHICVVDYKREGHRQATSWVIGDCLKNRYIASSRTFKPKDIIDDVRERFGVQITYNKAWRAREVAYDTLRGTPEVSYTFLPSFLHVLVECNPGTTTDLVLTQEGRFNYFFFALAASKEGYKFCRPIVCVDGAHLKGKYIGKMFIAVCKDDNNSIFPLAWGIGDVENDSSWLWFFTKFKKVYGDWPCLVIVLDRHPGIAKAIRKIYPGVFRRICMQHLLHNIKNKFRGISINMLYYHCAKAYRLCE